MYDFQGSSFPIFTLSAALVIRCEIESVSAKTSVKICRPKGMTLKRFGRLVLNAVVLS